MTVMHCVPVGSSSMQVFSDQGYAGDYEVICRMSVTLTLWKIKTGDRLVLVPLLQYVNVRHASIKHAASMKLQLNLGHKPADD